MKKFPIAAIGNVLEHYDGALYGFLIPFLAPLFFPFEDPIYSLLAGYALLPLGLVSKPLGAFVFGYLGDRWGCQASLRITLIGMALATIAMGSLPTFAQVGWLSPFLLALGRLLQNFFVAGEKTGGALFLLERTEEKKRGFASSLFDASGIGGILLAALGVMLIGSQYWRLLFWIGSLTGLIGLFLRRNLTPAAPKPRTSWKWNSSDAASLIAIAAASGFSHGNYYLLSSFLNGYLPLVSAIDTQTALMLNTILLAVDFLLLPFFGWLTLHIPKERLMFAALLTGASLATPLFLLLDGANAWIAGGVRIALTVIGVCFAAPYHAWAMETAPPDRRYMVCAIGSSLGGRLIAAPIPVLSLWLYHKTGWVASPALPLIAIALFALGAMVYQRIGKTVEI